MSNERRFSEQEVAFILERAATAEQESTAGEDGRALGDGSRVRETGMSLQQLTDIAREVGLSPAEVERAVAAVARGDLVPTQRQTSFGLPVGVGRVVEFSRAVTDMEWERMVVALRETFQARGRMRQEGSLRSWNNGNLQAMLEPTPTGHRLRLSTRKGEASRMVALGVGLMAASGLVAATAMLKGGMSAAALWSPAMMASMGAAVIALTGLRLPGWARTRASQMEAFAETAARILEEGDASEATTSKALQRG